MAAASLPVLTDNAMTATEPAFTTSASIPKPGGVDPLGLRQINFDLMDQVLPGLNNVAQHLRPFTVVTWAWRQAARLAGELGHQRVPLETLQDFVDRIEVIYVWSQLVRPKQADLPGKDVLASLISNGCYSFGGEDWKDRRERRRLSTALSAPINYGPALKALGWLQPDSEGKGAMVPTPLASAAVEAFHGVIAGHLEHPALCKLGAVSVTSAEVAAIADAWAWERPTAAEQQAMAASLVGPVADSRRREGTRWILTAAKRVNATTDSLELRRTLCGRPTDFAIPEEHSSSVAMWRALQVRQAFRLALEALFHWTLRQLQDGPKRTTELAAGIVEGVGGTATTEEWLQPKDTNTTGPADWLHRLSIALRPLDDPIELLQLIRAAIANCLSEAAETSGSGRDDRLPLARAAKEAAAWSERAPVEFVAHILESWLFGQHSYWSIGRGLNDARQNGSTILRLRATLEAEGWTLSPGFNLADRNAPEPTGDRLATALSLLTEAHLLP